MDSRFEPHFVCQGLLSKRPTQIVVPFPKGLQFMPQCRSISAVFGPLTLKLEACSLNVAVVMNMNYWGKLIDWCPRMSHALRYSESGYVEQSWRSFNEFGAKAWNFSRRYGWAGLQFLFHLFIWTKEISICDLPPQFWRPFWLPAFHRPWHWRHNFECSVSWKISHLNHR